MLTLYFVPGSSSMVPHIALREIGVDFVAKPPCRSPQGEPHPGLSGAQSPGEGVNPLHRRDRSSPAPFRGSLSPPRRAA